MSRMKSIEKLEKEIMEAQELVLKKKAEYQCALKKLGALNDALRKTKATNILAAIEKSGKSYEEILRLIRL